MPQRCVFALPSITGEIRTETHYSLLQAHLLLRAAGIDTEEISISDCPVLPVARNTLAAMFLADPEATDLFFIDYDVAFPPEAALRLLRRPEAIVGGAYRVKRDECEEFSVMLRKRDGVPLGRDGLIEAEFLAAGFLRIKRGVFELLKQKYPALRYEENVIRMANGTPIADAYDFFAMGVDEKRRRYTTEDYAFCQRWRDIGGTLWIDPDIDFSHVGRRSYHGNLHEHLLRLPGGGKDRARIAGALAIDGWMSEEELLWLAWQAQQHRSIVELGSHLGRSTHALASNTPGTVTAIDDWKGPREVVNVTWNADGLFRQFLANMQGLPVQAIRADHGDIERFAGLEPDMVFVDGAHEYESVKRDIAFWSSRLQSGGLLCGHDAHWPGVSKAVAELLPGAQTAKNTSIWHWTKP